MHDETELETGRKDHAVTIAPTPAEYKAEKSDIIVTATALPSAKKASRPHPLKSSVSGYLLYVLTLQDVEGADDSNANRFDNFKRHWSILCNNTQQAIEKHQQYVSEEIHFRKCPGHLSPKGTQFGYGLSMAYKECFDWALDNHDKWHADHNTVSDKEIPYIFLEDDARLYNSNFCRSEYRNRLWDVIPSDTTVLMLGGHNLFLQDKPGGEVERTDGVGLTGNEDIIPTFRRPNQSAGSYGFVIPKHERVAYLRRKVIKMLNRTFTPEGMLGFFGIDKQFYQYPMLKVYVTQPWLVYHEGGLWSNNKDRVRGEYGEGSGQYRWVPGLTGSFRNCSADEPKAPINNEPSDSSNRRITSSPTATGNWYIEERVIVSCQPLTVRIPQSLVMLQNNNTSNRIIAAVVSDANRTSWRSVIRSTWGKPDGFVANDKMGAPTTSHTQVNVFFLVTGSWEEIASEFRKQQDLVWAVAGEGATIQSETESALMTTLQVASFMKLVDDYASSLYSYLLRVPDDAYANLPGIQSQLSDYKYSTLNTQVGMWGTNCRTGLRPVHIGIPETQYSDYFFPEYCKGKAYALSQHFVRCAAAHIAETRIVALDDTYIGLLAERCGLQASQFLSSSSRVKGDERLLKLNFTQEGAIHRRHGQQQTFWS
ncbi:MAG: hypothetical protein SGBAC_012099 [Bacillariaceae sp.]